MNLQLSQFCHVFPEKGVLWHSLKRRIFRFPSAVLVKLQRSRMQGVEEDWRRLVGNEFDALRSAGYIVTEVEDALLLIEAQEASGPQGIQGLFLMLTAICNLVCDYCLFAQKGSESLTQPARYMSPDTARKGIDLFAKLTQSNQKDADGYWEQITFYGGEPLLNPHCLTEAVKHIRQVQKTGLLVENLSLVINTNGTKINEEFARFAHAESIEVQISIDGIHPHHKPPFDRSGKGSLESVLAGVGSLVKHQARFLPMITISPANVDHLTETVLWLHETFGIAEYGATIVMSGTDKLEPNFPKRVADAMLQTYFEARKVSVRDAGFASIWENLFQAGVRREECGASRKIVVFPQGELHTCQALETSGLTSCGTLQSPLMDSENRQQWRRRNRFNNPICKKCPAVGVCGGVCGAGSYHVAGDIQVIDPNTCGMTLELLQRW